jgi:cytochrome c
MVHILKIPAVCAIFAYAVSVFADGDPAHGEQLYQSRCGACHSVDENGPGPRHRGVVGRKAATQPGFDYSDALRQSGVIWTEAELDSWLSNPNARVPGNKMAVQLANDPRDRADLIAYLRSVSK